MSKYVIAIKSYMGIDLFQKLTAVCIYIWLIQFVNWITEDATIWQEQTISLVTWTLLIVTCTYWISHISGTVRVLIQFIAIGYVHVNLLDYAYVSFPSTRSWWTIQNWILTNVAPFEPYFWFSLAAGVIFGISMLLVQKKSKVYIMMGGSVVFFSIRDSYSTLVLWDEVLIILSSGFCLLVFRHFMDLKSRAPKSWFDLAQYPIHLSIPVITLLTITIGMGIVSPSIEPLIKDPYTLWKLSKGEIVSNPSKIKTAMGSEPRATKSGYSRDDSQLGGGFQFDYTPIMTITSDSRSYWRGEVSSLYTGVGWEKSENEKNQPSNAYNRDDVNAQSMFDHSLLQTKAVKQSIRMENDWKYPILFGAYEIHSILSLDQKEEQFDRLIWNSLQSELRIQDNDVVDYPKQYEIISEIPIIDIEQLRISEAINISLPLFSDYLQLPASLPERVKNLALELTVNANNAYDKAKLIETYLSQNYTYSNTPPRTQAVDQDFVDYFLFDSKIGYCDYFSTSMVILTRSIGLPSRWVKGFSTGQNMLLIDEITPEIIQAMIPDDIRNENEVLVRNSDAHSWLEIYFQGYGWIPFEPTPGFDVPIANALPAPSDSTVLDQQSQVTEPQDLQKEWSNRWIILSVIVISLFVSVGIVYGVRIKGYVNLLFNKFIRSTDVDMNHKVILEIERLLRYSKRKGYLKNPQDTMRETFSNWSTKSKWLTSDIDRALAYFEQAKYSQDEVTEEDHQQCAQLVKKIKATMK